MHGAWGFHGKILDKHASIMRSPREGLRGWAERVAKGFLLTFLGPVLPGGKQVATRNILP